MKVGDLVQYRHIEASSQIGLVVEVDNERDRYLIQWSNGRRRWRWFVAEDWVEVIQ